jgi:hypothetical protein
VLRGGNSAPYADVDLTNPTLRWSHRPTGRVGGGLPTLLFDLKPAFTSLVELSWSEISILTMRGAALAASGITPSMSRKGDCWDNAPMEGFFHTLKTERVHHRVYATSAEARRDLFGYIEGFYNPRRLHSPGLHQPRGHGA